MGTSERRGMPGRAAVLAACSVSHFLVDLACAFVLFRNFRDEAALSGLLILYNFCAFALQMPLGILADRVPHRAGQIAALGAALTALSFGVSRWMLPVLGVITAGLGNALFHVGGGLGSMSVSEGKAGPLGVFVSPGAIGLVLGGMLGRGTGAVTTAALWLTILLLLMAALLLARYGTADRQRVGENRCKTDELYEARNEMSECKAIVLASCAFLLFLVVIVRSHGGMSASFPWKSEFVLIFTLAVAGGKAAGGLLSDRFGLVPVSTVSLLGSALLFLVPNLPVCGILGMFLFNMTMPITLYRAALLLRAHRGFAFGLLTFALFLGFLPTAFGWGGLLPLPVWAILSLVLLLPALLLPKGRDLR